MNTLPEKLSDCIKLALHDEALCFKSPEYTINMNQFHEYDYETEKCAVCFAGAVMSKTLGCELTENLTSCDFDHETENKLDALDFIRSGSVVSAVKIAVNTEAAKPLLDKHMLIGVTEHAADRKQWRKDMRKIIKILQEYGL